ncbi:hypothetical protein L3X38_036803 [Prunus dulcis]|uniref:Uncharacterized protein n=1 Tax=Prunus dulcis TaxID=3755 RepID=A0AAD4V3E0_PRUDU|nr:hypothetical protein L3X38_036803 [Prunus dulcis]
MELLLTGKFPYWAGIGRRFKETYNSRSQNNQTHLHPDLAARKCATEKEAWPVELEEQETEARFGTITKGGFLGYFQGRTAYQPFLFGMERRKDGHRSLMSNSKKKII